MINLIAKSLWNRKGTALLTIFSIAISVALLIGVEQIRKGIRMSFSSAVSGTDLNRHHQISESWGFPIWGDDGRRRWCIATEHDSISIHGF